VTFDVGTKSIASDPPLASRMLLPDIPDASLVLQNEEHLVVETGQAARWKPGDVTLAIPGHVCPSVALHAFAAVIEEGHLVDEWQVTARDRKLTI
jgi:D-threonine aldolase